MELLKNWSEKLREDHLLYSAWIACVYNALKLEKMFPDEVKQAKKPILSEIDIRDGDTALSWAERTYDPYHQLRNNVETLDSIEAIRVYIKENDFIINKI